MNKIILIAFIITSSLIQAADFKLKFTNKRLERTDIEIYPRYKDRYNNILVGPTIKGNIPSNFLRKDPATKTFTIPEKYKNILLTEIEYKTWQGGYTSSPTSINPKKYPKDKKAITIK